MAIILKHSTSCGKVHEKVPTAYKDCLVMMFLNLQNVSAVKFVKYIVSKSSVIQLYEGGCDNLWEIGTVCLMRNAMKQYRQREISGHQEKLSDVIRFFASIA